MSRSHYSFADLDGFLIPFLATPSSSYALGSGGSALGFACSAAQRRFIWQLCSTTCENYVCSYLWTTTLWQENSESVGEDPECIWPLFCSWIFNNYKCLFLVRALLENGFMSHGLKPNASPPGGIHSLDEVVSWRPHAFHLWTLQHVGCYIWSWRPSLFSSSPPGWLGRLGIHLEIWPV